MNEIGDNDPNPRAWTEYIDIGSNSYINITDFCDYLHNIYIEPIDPPLYGDDTIRINVNLQAQTLENSKWFNVKLFSDNLSIYDIHLPIFKLGKTNLRITSITNVRIKLNVGMVSETYKDVSGKLSETYGEKFIIHSGIIEPRDNYNFRKSIEKSSCKCGWF